MNVLVIPEDFRNDQYILKPIVNAMMKSLGKETAKVEICRNPLLGGVTEALKWEKIEPIIDSYRMVNLFLFCVDKDCEDGRKESLKNLENRATNKAFLENRPYSFFAENAWQEIEVWLLAGLTLPKSIKWKEVRQERDPKEKFFKPIVKERKLESGLGGGRKTLGEEAAKQYARIKQLCDEVNELENRIRNL